MFSNNKYPSQHAIVMGGSLAGLLTARVLSAYFEQVTLLERDPVDESPGARKGQPQTRHLHGLLASGLEVMTRYFPDLPQALDDGGAVMPDFAGGMHWHAYGGYRTRFTMGVKATLMTRPFLESLVRSRVMALPNITLLDQCSVKRLLASDEQSRITGIEVEQRGDEVRTTTMNADLIVDCTGRGSRSPQWLAELGYDAPPTSEVRVDVGYATRIYRRDPGDPRGQEWVLTTPDAPRETRFGGIFPVEGDRWICSIGGWHGDHGPADEDQFMEFARSLPHPEIARIISQSEPISDIVLHKFPHSLRRHYEKLRSFPQGYLVLGDAISSFNPIYGQGMTSAALQTAELDKVLAKGTPLMKIAPAFFKRAAKVVDIPWQLAVGEDFRYAETNGPKPAGVDLINKYVARVHRATLRDEVVCHAFLKVMNLMEPPTSLFHPRIVWRVIKYGGRPRLPAPGGKPQVAYN